jgi:hypothetical protein
MEKLNNETILSLWYNGAGDLYRRNHGLPGSTSMFRSRLNDNPRQRLFAYRIGFSVYFLTAVFLLYFSATILYSQFESTIKLFIIFTNSVLSFYLLLYSYWAFTNSKKIHTALKYNANTDLIDSFRMNSLTRAINRLIKQGNIIKEGRNWLVK